MKFSYNWLQSFFKEPLPKPEKLADLLINYFFEVEGVVRKKNDWILDIDILPSRAHDCLSHIGVAREIAAITGLKFTPNELFNDFLSKSNFQKNTSSSEIKIKVQNKRACDRYLAIEIRGIKVGPSSKTIKDFLESCGVQSINNVVDIANYVMLETGQPLHVFDLDKIQGKEINVRSAKKGEIITTLDNKKIPLNENVLVIADKNDPIGIAGIKGGKKAEVDSKTKNIVLESANFNRLIIRYGAKNTKLMTDASLRFEHGLDPNLAGVAAKRASELITKVAGGKIISCKDFYPLEKKSQQMRLRIEYVKELLGIKINSSEIKKILLKLGFKIIKETSKELLIKIPTRRMDIKYQEDLIEEIGRIYGYEKIEAVMPICTINPPRKNWKRHWEGKAKNFLKGIGFSEVYNYSFISEDHLDLLDLNPKNLVEVDNPVSLEHKYLRPNLAPRLIGNIKDNERFFKRIKIFELGNVFYYKNNQIEEKNHLSICFSDESFFEAKGIIEALFKEFGLANVNYLKPIEKQLILNPKKSAEIFINKTNIGNLGVVSSEILKKVKIKSKITFIDIDFDKIIKMANDVKEYSPIIKFPTISRDLSILVPFETSNKLVLDKILSCKIKELKGIELFDVYEKSESLRGKKSFTYRLTYQSNKKTLTDDETNQFHQKIINKIKLIPDWQIR